METNKWNGTNQAPGSACHFVMEDAVKFAQSEKNDKGMVKLVGYRGDIIKHWYWGNLAFDMAGLHFDKPRTPGLIDHMTSKRLTYSTERAIEPETFIAGPFLENNNAKELENDIKNGFPFQASLSLLPEIVEQIEDGESVEVNGKMLKGPGAVFRKAAIYEISAVVFGAFSNTESAEYNDNNTNVTFKMKETLMSDKDKTKLTLEQFKSDHAELYSQVFEMGKADGGKSSIERFARLQKACGDDNELIVNCFSEGLDTGDAMAKRIEKLSAEKTELAQKLAEKESGVGNLPDPALSEFNNQPAPATPGKEKQFDEKKATDVQLKEHYSKDQDLQDEFTCADAYIASVRHPAD